MTYAVLYTYITKNTRCCTIGHLGVYAYLMRRMTLKGGS